jgi:hypothetical protein
VLVGQQLLIQFQVRLYLIQAAAAAPHTMVELVELVVLTLEMVVQGFLTIQLLELLIEAVAEAVMTKEVLALQGDQV